MGDAPNAFIIAGTAHKGEGMRGISSGAKSEISWRGQSVDMTKVAGRLKRSKHETMLNSLVWVSGRVSGVSGRDRRHSPDAP